MRAKTKGLMFFFLACRDPAQVSFPAFVNEKKRVRAQPFSLAEKGRLVSILSDPENVQIVSELMNKWDRADLDAKAGAKGVAHYWDRLAVLFNDPKYVPPTCQEFADYVHALGDSYSYATGLVPEYRTGEFLRDHWGKLRQAYGVFSSRYDRSGCNEPDPTKYSTDLPTLLMHWTFHNMPLGSWAAKSCGDDQIVDDAGDGATSDTSARKKTRRPAAGKSASKQNTNDRILAGAAMYETLHSVKVQDLDPEEAQRHKQRVRRMGCILDSFLDSWEKGL